jgi:hypothetical protein
MTRSIAANVTQQIRRNISRDIVLPDPCNALQEAIVRVEEIIFGGKKYYYAADPDSIYDYKVYIHDPTLDGFKHMNESDPLYAQIVSAISTADAISDTPATSTGDATHVTPAINVEEENDKPNT